VQWGCIGMVVPNKAAAVQTTNNIFVAAIADTIDGGGTPSRHHHRSKTAPLLTHPDFDTVWRKRPPTLTRSHTLRTETDKFRCHHRHRTEHHTRRTEENIGWCDYKSITHNIYNTYVDGSVNALHRYIRNCDGRSERRTCQLLYLPVVHHTASGRWKDPPLSVHRYRSITLDGELVRIPCGPGILLHRVALEDGMVGL